MPLVIVLLWALLFVVKDPVFATQANPFHYYQVRFIGFSYIIFRCIQYVMDADSLEGRSLWTLINFVLFFPTLFAGPLERYENFQKFQDGPARESPALLPALHLLANGLIKKYVLADNLMAFGFFAMPADASWPVALLWVGVLAQLLLLYLDFSGYCDMAAGLSRLMGFDLVQNFDHPWRAASLQDFWNRWNISLSGFFKDYFFTPLSYLVFSYAAPRFRFTLIALTYFATMVLIALWHGLTLGFLAFGILHGLALVLAQLARQLWPALAAWEMPRPVRALQGAVLYGFISFSLMVAYCGIEKSMHILSLMLGLGT